MRPIPSLPEVPRIAPKPSRAAAAPAPAALEIHYQPMIAVATGHVAGAEALLRRRMSSGVVQIAARFLPLAEATGLLVEIGRRVVDKACGVAADWQVFQRGTSVTVNISARQLEDPALPGWIEAVLARHALPADLLVLDIPEVTVAAAALDGGPGLQHMREIADLGVRIAVDDVGTGPVAPTYLPSVPVSILKIDGRFVRGLRAGDQAGQLFPAMIALAHQFGLQAVAEGVESDEELAVLRELGCDFAQGYLLGHPTSPDRIAQRLRY